MTRPTRYLLRGLALLGLSTLLCACPYNIWDWQMCDVDPMHCDLNDTFVIDPTCTLTGNLNIQLGQGEAEFEPLEADEAPQTYSASGQGATIHHFFALRILNPAVDYPMLQVALTYEVQTDEVVVDPDSGDASFAWRFDTERLAIFSPDHYQWVGDTVEMSGIWLQVSPPFGTRRRVTAMVTDPCGREGTAMHEW